MSLILKFVKKYLFTCQNQTKYFPATYVNFDSGTSINFLRIEIICSTSFEQNSGIFLYLATVSEMGEAHQRVPRVRGIRVRTGCHMFYTNPGQAHYNSFRQFSSSFVLAIGNTLVPVLLLYVRDTILNIVWPYTFVALSRKLSRSPSAGFILQAFSG